MVAVERDRRVAAVARANLQAVLTGREAPVGGEPPRVKVACEDVMGWLGSQRASEAPQGFDLIYVDPPYAAGLHEPIATAVREGRWLAPGGTMIWECGSGSVPPDPAGWERRDRRRYGGTTLVLLCATSVDAGPRPGNPP